MNLTKILSIRIPINLSCKIPINLSLNVLKNRKNQISNNQKAYFSTIATDSNPKKAKKTFRIPVPLNASEIMTVSNCEKSLIKHAKDTYNLVG